MINYIYMWFIQPISDGDGFLFGLPPYAVTPRTPVETPRVVPDLQRSPKQAGWAQRIAQRVALDETLTLWLFNVAIENDHL
jgi:hypothetical protein